MRLFRVEGTVAWVTYFVCPDDVHDLKYCAMEALNDDRDGRNEEPFIQDLEEIYPTRDTEEVIRWIKRDGWENSAPFIMGDVEDEANSLSCEEIFMVIKRNHDYAVARAEADARQLKLPLEEG